MGYVVCVLLMALRSYRERLYTPEQLKQIQRDRAVIDGTQALEAPRKPYRWWKYTGLL
jgi:hypothetical protein